MKMGNGLAVGLKFGILVKGTKCVDKIVVEEFNQHLAW